MWTNILTNKIALPLVIIMIFGVAGATAADKRLEKGAFGVKAGWIAATDFSMNWKEPQPNSTDYTTKIGLYAGVFYDIPIMHRLLLSPAIDLLDINVVGDRQWMIDISLGVKRVLHLRGSSVAVKPGIAIGYAYLADFRPMKSTEYTTWKVLVETAFLASKHYSYILELSVTNTDGGNSEVDVDANPIIGLRFGVAY